jgi:cell division protein FtsN
VWLLMVVSALAIVIGFYAYQRSAFTMANLKNQTLLTVGHYLPSILEKEKPKPVGKKVAVVSPEDSIPIHFDFYDELPKVQLASSQKPLVDKRKPAETVAEEEPEEESTPAEAISAKSVEQDLEADLSAMRLVDNGLYILQMGIFHNMEAANRYRKALLLAGLKVEVRKIKQGQQVVYRLQQGPYNNLEQLKTAKKRLSERGVTCDIHKLTPYDS